MKVLEFDKRTRLSIIKIGDLMNDLRTAEEVFGNQSKLKTVEMVVPRAQESITIGHDAGFQSASYQMPLVVGEWTALMYRISFSPRIRISEVVPFEAAGLKLKKIVFQFAELDFQPSFILHIKSI